MDILNTIPVEFAVAMVGLAVAGVVFTFSSSGAERAEARETLRQVDGKATNEVVEDGLGFIGRGTGK